MTLSPAELMEQEAERHLRWNFVAGCAEAALFFAGTLGFASVSTVMPLYLRHLTSSTTLIALMVAIPDIGWLLPQLFVAPWVERLPRKMPFVRWVSLFSERAGFLFMALIALGLSTSRPGLALVLFPLALSLHAFGLGSLGPAWVDVQAKMYPPRWRGRFLGMSNFLGSALAIPAALAAGRVLGGAGFPANFALCFLIAYLLLMASWGFLASMREPAGPAMPPAVQSEPYLRRLVVILRRDRNYRRFLLSRLLMALGEMATGFAALYAVGRFGLSDAVAGQFTAFNVAGRLAGNLLLGFLGDRRGHKLTLELGTGIGVLTMLVALLAPSAGWFNLVFALQGVAGAGVGISATVIVMSLCPPEVRPTYVGLGNTAIGIMTIAAPLLGGAVISAAGYPAVFAAALLVRGAGWLVLHRGFQDPQRVEAPGLAACADPEA